MPTIRKKQLQEYEKLRRDYINGRVLHPDGIRFICEANNFDAEKIGQYFLDLLPKIREER